ncbi:MAG: hypothetical protein HYY53_03750 [candidate division NC10 bacterium]|nr:hypothetical protein [candidate division NC10 bacterium]MBI4413280.1 hypothetical protein [candidate division NC10 bacterium]
MSGRRTEGFEAVKAGRRALGERGPWVTYLACPEEPVRLLRGPALLAALDPRAHRKPNGDPLFWDFFVQTPEGYRLEVLKQGRAEGPVRPVFWARIMAGGAVELARPVGSRIFTPGHLALGSHGVALEAMGLFTFCAWLYRQVGYEGRVRAGLTADRVGGLVLDPHPDGEAGEAPLSTDTPVHEGSLSVAALAAGGPDLVCAFLDSLYREAAGVPCPHFRAGGSLRQSGGAAPQGGG